MELAFNVQNRPAFELPYSEISNTNLAGKNEVAVEFNLGAEPSTNGANGHKEGSTRNRGRKAAAGRDELVEMRFYIPGTVSKKEKNENAESDADDLDEDAEETNAANLFYETLIDKAEIGEVAGDTYATFLDVLHLTPRFVMMRSSDMQRLIFIQRAIRHRHVRKLISITRQNIRLQDPIPVH
jgi:structure-specific recognition protein 1